MGWEGHRELSADRISYAWDHTWDLDLEILSGESQKSGCKSDIPGDYFFLVECCLFLKVLLL